jgi:tRNA(Leu) C34 or U34 (ribose-2'-O)-methylase TrmL
VSAVRLIVLFTPAVIKPAKDLTGPEKVVCAMVLTSYERIRPTVFVTSAESVDRAGFSQLIDILGQY